MSNSNNSAWKKYITPGVIILIVTGLIGFIANGFSEDLKEKADNKTLQMYIEQQEKKDVLINDQRNLEQRLQQKSVDDRFMMQQNNIEHMIEILKDK